MEVPSLLDLTIDWFGKHLHLFDTDTITFLPHHIQEAVLERVQTSKESINDDALQTFVETTMRASNEPLSTLSLSGFNLIGDQGLRSIAGLCDQLTYLDLSNCDKVTDDGLSDLVSTARNLRTLVLLGCKKLKGLSWARSATALEDLNLELCSSVNDFGVQLVVNSCSSLKALNLGSCKQISNVSFQLIAQKLGRVLESLNLGGCQITDFDLEDIGKHCTRLHSIVLRACRLVSNTGLKSLGALSRRQLKAGGRGFVVLDLGGVRSVTDTAVIPLLNASPNIEEFDIRGNPCITRDVVLCLENKTQLKHANLSYCDKITEVDTEVLFRKLELNNT